MTNLQENIEILCFLSDKVNILNINYLNIRHNLCFQTSMCNRITEAQWDSENKHQAVFLWKLGANVIVRERVIT